MFVWSFYFSIYRDGVVGYSDWLRAGWSRVLISAEARVLPKSPYRPCRSPQPAVKWVPVIFFSGVKRLGRDVDHLPPFSAKVKN